MTQRDNAFANASESEIGTVLSSVPWKSRIGTWKLYVCLSASRRYQSASMRAPIIHSTGRAATERKPSSLALKERICFQSRARGIQDDGRDAMRNGRALHELGHDRTAHGVADQEQALCAVRERVIRGGLQILPLGEPHVVKTARAARGAHIAAVGDQEHRQTGAVEGGHDA